MAQKNKSELKGYVENTFYNNTSKLVKAGTPLTYNAQDSLKDIIECELRF